MGGYADVLRLTDATLLRALPRVLSGDLSRFQPPAEPDPALVEVVDTPFPSVDEVMDRLSRLERRLRASEDRRAVFLTIYTRMTREVAAGIEAGRFTQPDWMGRYLTAFANYYRRAFLAFERGNLDAVPAPWRIAFGTALAGDGLVMQDAFLGVNAHINYDLALALDDVGIDPQRAERYADHREIDEILAGLVDAQQTALAEVYAAGVEDVDEVLGGADESLTLLSLTEGRAQAWRVARVMTDVDLAPVAAYARWVLRTTATGGALFVRSPALDDSLLGALRAVEAQGLTLDAVLERVDAHLDDASTSLRE